MAKGVQWLMTLGLLLSGIFAVFLLTFEFIFEAFQLSTKVKETTPKNAMNWVNGQKDHIKKQKGQKRQKNKEGKGAEESERN